MVRPAGLAASDAMPHPEGMKLPARVSRRDAGVFALVVLAAALFLVCAFFVATNF